MTELFSKVLNMSLTASLIILFVLGARLLLKKAPKIYSYLLWSVVLFRLLCPISLSAPISMLTLLQPEVTAASERTSVVSFVPSIQAAVPLILEDPPQQIDPNMDVKPESVKPEASEIVAGVWIFGVFSMAAYSAFQYLKLRRRLVGAIAYSGNVRLSDYIDSPFVMGTLFPRIYMPSTVPARERKYILAHERHHIRRGDHIWKMLAYAALCIHWFNPLVWVAFILAGKDMEMSCDEAVLKKFGPQIRGNYSASLLRLATHRGRIAGMPLAFGEGDTKGRIMNMARWRKPKVWVSVLFAIVCVMIAVACAVNPKTEDFDWSITRVDGPASASLGDFHYTLPEGMSLQVRKIDHQGNAWDYGHEFHVGNTVAGGLALRYQPSQGSPEALDWEKTIGVPEALDEAMAFIGGSSPYGDWETTYSTDIPLNYDANGLIIPDENGKRVLENEVTHYFFVNGTDVYDLWLYIHRCSRNIQEKLLKSAYIEGVTDIAAKESAAKEEAQALEKCRAVLEKVQSSTAYQIVTDRKNGEAALNETSTITRWGYGENRLEINKIPESGGYESVFGGLLWDGVSYEHDSQDVWKETDRWDHLDPWLSRFRWNENTVSYSDTLQDETGTTVMLRIDEPWADMEGLLPYYFVNMNFDADGRFRNAKITVNLLLENEIQETESIVSLESDLIAAEIDKEYCCATGNPIAGFFPETKGL